MLQISSKKFFKSDQLEETLHRGTFFTNYRIFGRENYETECGRLLPSSPWSGLITVTCETTERLEKFHADGTPSVLISIGSSHMLQDFAAIASFALNITCTLDPDLTRRLIAPTHLTLGVASAPQKYLKRIFDTEIHSKAGDDEALRTFTSNLLALDRKSYEAAMRAIRRYVVGTHRISDDIDLAYTLFVASIESLAQDFDAFTPDWAGLSHDKRTPIDDALAGADEELAIKVRQAVLAGEHRSLARRYKEFTLANIRPSFFRSDSEGTLRPIKRCDLETLLGQAYSIRSKYVHRLREIPRPVSLVHDHSETVFGDGAASLTFQGLARLSRHVIMNFIDRAPRTEKEDFEWRSALPNIVSMQLASQYWVWRAEGYSTKSTNRYLGGFLEQISSSLQNAGEKGLSDMRAVLAEAEKIMPGLASPQQRRPIVLLYYLYNSFIVAESKMEDWRTFFERFAGDLDEPSIESAIAYLAGGRTPEWTLDEAEGVHAAYFAQRHHARGLKLDQFFETALTLMVASLALGVGNVDVAKKYVAEAVENNPGNRRLLDLEEAVQSGARSTFAWQEI
jgi:hypothetical protein